MTGTLKENIRNDFSAGFHDNCIRLIGEACLDLKNKHIVTVDWDEENISANMLSAKFLFTIRRYFRERKKLRVQNV